MMKVELETHSRLEMILKGEFPQRSVDHNGRPLREPTKSESFFLRTWYKRWGQEEPFDPDGYKCSVVLQMIASWRVSFFSTAECDWDMVYAYVNSTARPKELSSVTKRKKRVEKKPVVTVTSVKPVKVDAAAFLARLKEKHGLR
jgi:hypothetical protein